MELTWGRVALRAAVIAAVVIVGYLSLIPIFLVSVRPSWLGHLIGYPCGP